MKKYYLTYSDDKFIKQKLFAIRAAKYIGGFDEVISRSPANIDPNFFQENIAILKQKRGAGYWLWKPYFIYQVLSCMDFGDYLFYSDSGAYFLKNVGVLISELEKTNQDIMGFELPLIEEQWTKKELLINLDCLDDRFTKTNQMLASFMLIKNSIDSLRFFKRYLELSCDIDNITDSYQKGVSQDNHFIEHRHDQSIFSLLYKKNNYTPFKDPSQLGKYPLGYSGGLSDDDVVTLNTWTMLSNSRYFKANFYPQKYSMVLYHNKRDDPIRGILVFMIKTVLSRLNLYKGIIR